MNMSIEEYLPETPILLRTGFRTVSCLCGARKYARFGVHGGRVSKQTYGSRGLGDFVCSRPL
jgi:hypothetical protein